MPQPTALLRRLGGLACAALVVGVFASPGVDAAPIPLIATDTLVDQPPDGVVDDLGGTTADGYALNHPAFIDVAVYLFDFGGTTPVASATLAMTTASLFTNSGQNPTIQLFTYADDSAIGADDFAKGAGTVRDAFTYSSVAQTHTIDVTTAVNQALLSSRYIGFRFENSRPPSLLNGNEGVLFTLTPSLDAQYRQVPVPEPTALTLLGLGLAGAMAARRRLG